MEIIFLYRYISINQPMKLTNVYIGEAKYKDIHYNTKTDHAYKGDKFNDLNNITHLDVADFFENH